MNRKKLKFAVLGIAVVLAIGLLAYSAVGGSWQYSLSVKELMSKGRDMYDQPVKVSGLVSKGSIDYRIEQMKLNFVLEDKKKKNVKVPVVYGGVAPDNFGPGVEVVVDGKYDGQVLTATGILTKCPSKYKSK